jgi:hypothetical protein
MSFYQGQPVIVDGNRHGTICKGNLPLPGYAKICVSFPGTGDENIELARIQAAPMSALTAGKKVMLVAPAGQGNHSWPATVKAGKFDGSADHAVITLGDVAKGQTLVVPISALTLRP